jgi:hypothetical protein
VPELPAVAAVVTFSPPRPPRAPALEGYSAVLDEVAAYDATDAAGQITAPLYITDPDGEQFSLVSPPNSPRSARGHARALH